MMNIYEDTVQKYEQVIKRSQQYIEFPAQWLGRSGHHTIRGHMTIREIGTVEIEQNGLRIRRPYGHVTFHPIQILFIHDGEQWQAIEYRPLPLQEERTIPRQSSPLTDHRAPQQIYPYKHKWADTHGVPENATEEEIRIDLLWKVTWEIFIRSTGSKH